MHTMFSFRKDDTMYWKGLSKTNEKRLSKASVTPLSQTETPTLSDTNKDGLQDLLATQN